MAVEDTGDIDLDGFSDVAISAPYINNGVVYIFRGSASGLVTDTYQVGLHESCDCHVSIKYTCDSCDCQMSRVTVMWLSCELFYQH